jgi:hypothetical protein
MAMDNEEAVLQHLASVIPDSAYPRDQSDKDQCKDFEVAIYGGWEILTNFGAKSFEFRGADLSGTWARMFAQTKRIYIGYLSICSKSKASAPAFFMRELTRKYPESGLAWYCLLLAQAQGDPANASKEEVSRCLANAAEFGCDYVKPDGKGGLIFSPLS